MGALQPEFLLRTGFLDMLLTDSIMRENYPWKLPLFTLVIGV